MNNFKEYYFMKQINSIDNYDENGTHIKNLKVVNDKDATKELLQDIISWKQDPYKYENIETILKEKYFITKR